MKLYFCNSRTVDCTYIIRAENEWQARDIADNTDHERREWEAELDGDFGSKDYKPPIRRPYYTLGNGTVSELKQDGKAGLCFAVYDEPWYGVVRLGVTP